MRERPAHPGLVAGEVPNVGSFDAGTHDPREEYSMNEARKPDEVIDPRAPVRARTLLRDAAVLLPNLVKLIARLLRDPRVPRRTKLVVGAALAYLITPIDLIPDALPLIGQADDLLVAVYAVHRLLEAAGDEVVLEHWEGPRDLLELVRTILDLGTDFLPRRLRLVLSRLSG